MSMPLKSLKQSRIIYNSWCSILRSKQNLYTLLKSDEYPVIFPANESVEGVVYFDIDDEDIVSLDTFEGEYYERKEVELLVNHEKIIAHTYVLKPAYYDIIDPKLWSETLFEKEGIHRFLKEYKGFA